MLFSRFPLVLSLFLICSSTTTAQTSRPNVIMILADDLGFGDLGCFGHPTFKTPHIDQMAAEGARLTRFRTPTPYCAPTRASLLTGRYPIRCGMTNNPTPDANPAANTLALPKSELTLAELMRSKGYATSIVGKWHLGHQPESLPTQRGFDEYFGIPYSNDMRPVQILDGTQVVESPAIQASLTRRYTQRAIDFIERNQSKPFFLYLAHAMPHKPLATNETYYKKSGSGLYADVLLDLDNSVGELLDAVKRLGIDEETLVLFSSDNGPWFGGSTGGLRGMKAVNFEGGHRVPLIARWPGRIPAGHRNDAPAIMMDLFPTILNAAGIELPQDRVIDGKDCMPLLTGPATSQHTYLFGLKSDRLTTIQDTRWKLHVIASGTTAVPWKPNSKPWTDPRAPDGVTILAPREQYGPENYPGVEGGDAPKAMQLFDLQNDPAEMHDVASEHPTEVARMLEAYRKADVEMRQ